MTPTSVSLADGLVIDSSRQIAYVMNAERRIEAIELTNGNRLWTTASEAKPLAVAQGRLVAQGDTQNPGRLDVVSFRLLDGAPDALAAGVELPGDMHATLSDLPGRSFRVSASSQGSSLNLSWSESFANAAGKAQGYLPAAEEGMAPSGGITQASSQRIERNASRQRLGAATVDLASGSVSTGQVATQASSRTSIARRARPYDTSGRLVHASADGRHEVRVERDPQGDLWNAYRWTVYRRGSDEALGSMNHYSATAPFVVNGSQLIFVTTPNYRVVNGETVATPMQVQAMNLKTGQSTWAASLNDPNYSGPIAP